MPTDDEETIHSPTGFVAPEPELEDTLMVCAGCGVEAYATEMGATVDDIIWNDNGAVMQITRVYLHDNPECLRRFDEIEDAEQDAK